MKSASQHFPWLLFFFTLLLLLVDLYLSLTNPISPSVIKLGLGKDLIRGLLSISFTVPIFASFFFGGWTYLVLYKIPKYTLFSKGVLTLTLVLLIGIVLSVIRTHFFFSDTFGMYKIFTIIINYIYSFGYLLGFGLLLYSTKKLLPEVGMWNLTTSICIALIIGAFYSIVILTNPDRIHTSSNWIKPSLFLPDTISILTIITPTILGWIFAIWVTFRFADIYATLIKPSEKESFREILYGLFFIVFSVIMLQAILSIGTTRFVDSGLGLILAILYLFVALLTIGNFLILKGSRKLPQII